MTASATHWTDVFDCDGDCGATVAVTSRDPQRGVTRATLESLGWLMITGAEAYCPECQASAAKIAKAQMPQKKKK